MARKPLTPATEDRLITEATAARDSDSTQLVPADLRPGDPGSVVLSVRLSAEEARAIRAIAAERGIGLSETMAIAIRAFAGAAEPEVAAKRTPRRLSSPDEAAATRG
jgi:hypothetical protein